MSEKRMRFLNTHVDNLTMAEAVEEAKKLVQKGGKSYVVTPNVDHIVNLYPLQSSGGLCPISARKSMQSASHY